MNDYGLDAFYRNCSMCPRNCGADRTRALGFCGCANTVRAARAGLHYYEEPYLSGINGSGTVFFTGCSLGCLYCQNAPISHGNIGWEISVDRLAQIFLELQEKKAHNINLVTGTHFTPSIAQALRIARDHGLCIPVVWNSSGYEKPEVLKLLDGLVDIFMPDFKTMSADLGVRYMKAADYPERAREALACMVDMAGQTEFEPLDGMCGAGSDEAQAQEIYAGENVLMKKGVVVRHLVIPGHADDSVDTVGYLYKTYGDRIWISIMSQYTPAGVFARRKSGGSSNQLQAEYPELCRTLKPSEYEKVTDYAIDLGMENCMIQEGASASESFIPAFDASGILPDSLLQTCRPAGPAGTEQTEQAEPVEPGRNRLNLAGTKRTCRKCRK